MCGRLDQNHTAVEYVAAMHWPHAKPVFNSVAAPSFNAAPGTRRPLLHVLDDALVIDDWYWGYRAAWAKGKVPIAINARIEKLSNRYWGRLLKSGRSIVPAAGWYEWTGEKGHKQAWHIHLKTREPLFIAALAAPGPAAEHAAEAGFAIISADAVGGMVDIHDRRPIVLSAADAALWLDPGLSPEQAEQLARSQATGSEAFAWHAVGAAIGKAGNEGAQLAAQIALQLD
ncbi:MAG: SOS response-associated peptidase family protein [Pseudomonadota bacterium]